MSKDDKKKEVCIKCPPLKKVGDKWIGMTVAEVRKELGAGLEVPNGAPAVISHDCGKTFKNVDENHKLEAWDVLEFGRTSAVKGRRIKRNRCEFGRGCPHCS